MPWKLLFIISFLILGSLPEGWAQRVFQGDTTIIVQPTIDTAELAYVVDSVDVGKAGENRANKAAHVCCHTAGPGTDLQHKILETAHPLWGIATMGFFIDYNHKKYEQFRNAYLEKTSLPEELWKDPLAINVAEDNLQNGIDFYRRNRDLLMILLAGVYFLQIVDAHVDAHLMDFDISEDISFRIQPG
jgi:hypothetical protein